MYFILSLSKSIDNNSHIEKIQRIYSNYIEISKSFIASVERDIMILDGIEKEKEEWNVIERIMVDLYLPGLICFLYEKIIEIREGRNKNEPWIISELLVKGTFKKMSVSDSIKKLNEISKGNSLPIIIFDECQSSDSSFAKKYCYIRRYIRMMGLLGVFMGTNANLANFVNHNLASGSRASGSMVEIPWCFIIHRLTPVSKEFIDNRIEEIKEVVSNNVNEEKYQKIERFTRVIGESLKNERPLFAQIVLDSMKEQIINGMIDKPLDAISNLCRDLIMEFTKRKITILTYSEMDLLSYNYSNLSLTLPEFWRKNTREAKFEKAQGIHTHIAYLYVPEEIIEMTENKNYFGLTIQSDGFSFTGTSMFTSVNNGSWLQLKYLKFEREQTFKKFSEEPFSQQGLIGEKNYMNIFMNRMALENREAELQRISAVAGINHIYEKYKIPIVDSTNAWNIQKLYACTS